MDKISALNLYRQNLLEQCEIIEVEEDSFNIKIVSSITGDSYLTSDDGNTPMLLIGRSYSYVVAKRIGFKPEEIEFKDVCN